MSGSRGEANFVWKCKSCKVCLIHVAPGMFFCESGKAWLITHNYFAHVTEGILGFHSGCPHAVRAS